MSRINQPKNKRLDNLEVKTSAEIWQKVGYDKENKKYKYKLNEDLEVFGKVSKGSSSYISKPNKFGTKAKYVDDFSSLNKNTKTKICDLFENSNKKTVYLVEKKKEK